MTAGFAAQIDDARLGLEFAWTAWADSCRDRYSIVQCCRRPTGHDGNHASGFGDGRLQWLQDGLPA